MVAETLLSPSARSLTGRRGRGLRLECLQARLRLRRVQVVRGELQEALVRGRRDGRVAGVLGCLRELELHAGLGRLDLRELLVDADELGGGRAARLHRGAEVR